MKHGFLLVHPVPLPVLGMRGSGFNLDTRPATGGEQFVLCRPIQLDKRKQKSRIAHFDNDIELDSVHIEKSETCLVQNYSNNVPWLGLL